MPTLLPTVLGAPHPAIAHILREIDEVRGQIRPASHFAVRCGYRNRDQLRHALERAGLPGIEVLGQWSRILAWTRESQASGLSLCHLTTQRGEDVSAAYRLVHDLTWHPWSQVRANGLEWLVGWMQERKRYGTLRVRRKAGTARQRGVEEIPASTAPAIAGEPHQHPAVRIESDSAPSETALSTTGETQALETALAAAQRAQQLALEIARLGQALAALVAEHPDLRP